MGREAVSTALYRVYLQRQALRALAGTTAANPADLEGLVAALAPLIYEDEDEIREAIGALARAGQARVEDGRVWLHDGVAPS